MRQGISVAIRADASHAIGAGHVMRCLALAHALRGRGEHVAFVCRERPGHLLDVIRAASFTAFGLAATGDDIAGTLGVPPEQDVAETLAAMGGPVRRLVVDHYGADESWERAARAAGVARIVAVDDLARRHDCDVLVDINLSASAMGHERLVSEGCDLLLGPRFAMLAPEFAACRERAAARREGRLRRLLVSFGGGDVTEPTRRALEALADPRFAELDVEVVLPAVAAGEDPVAPALAKLPRVRRLGRIDDMAERMTEADFMLGGAGGQGLERCCLGLPAAVVALATNQEAPAEALARTGACRLLGRSADVAADGWRESLAAAVDDPESLRRMARAGMELVDGLGAERVVDAVLAGAPVGPARDRVRPMTERDLETVWRWRNREDVRHVMFSNTEIAWDDHVRWFAQRARSAGMRALVYESAGTPLGFVKFERFEPATGSCEWGFYVGPPDAPRGAGSRMGWLALTYAFGDLGVSQVAATVTASNERSLRYHDRLGFTRTGISTRESSRGPVGVVEYVLSTETWREIAARLKAELFGV